MIKNFLQLVYFAAIAKAFADYELWENIKGNYTGLPKPKDGPLIIDIHVDLVRVIAVSESEQQIKLYLSVLQRWKISDTDLWKPSHFGNLQYIVKKPESFWMPDIVAYNSLDSEGAVHSPFSEMSSYIKVHSNGTIIWQGDTVLKVYCNIKLTAFPSDSYTCDLCFGSRNYGKNEIYLNWWNRKSFNSGFIKNKEWIITVRQEYKSTSEQCSNWDQLASKVVLKMSLERHANAYHVTFFVPCLFLSIIMFLAFIVPTETGERLNLIVTVLLTIIVFQQLTLDIIPPYSFPILSQYYFFCLILAFSSTVIDIILLNVYTRSGRCLPDILHTFFIEWVGALVYMTRNYYNYGTGEYDIPYQHVQKALQQEEKINKIKYGKIENTIYSVSPDKEIIWNSFKISTDCLHKRNKTETIKLLIQEEKMLALKKSSECNFEKIRDEVEEEVNKHQIYRLVRVLDRLFLFASFFAVVSYSSYYLALVSTI